MFFNRHLVKKIIDVGGAVLGLVFFSPLYLPIILAIKLESRGPVVVKLDRISGGKKIKVYKFRSMIDGAHSMKRGLAHLNERKDGPLFKIKNDPRLTGIGRVIRKFRIDEIPQLFNVLKGEMSLVGPRPHEPEEVAAYPEGFRHLPVAKAGVTGFSQVNGASSLPFLKELEFDDYYLKNWSVGFDLKIIAKTLWIIFSDPTAV